jgi:hypothetical protein
MGTRGEKNAIVTVDFTRQKFVIPATLNFG